MKKAILAAKKLLSVLVLSSFSFGAFAGIPVIDGANLTQNVLDVIEAVTQTAQQLNQYEMQMDQYQNQLQNTKNLASFEWNDAQSTMTNLQNLTDTLNSYKQKLGTINGYLDKYKQLSDYESNSCFTALGCTSADKTALTQNQQFHSDWLRKTQMMPWLRVSISSKAI